MVANRAMNLPDSVNISYPIEGYPVFEVRNSLATASIALHGAHVMTWAPIGQDPVLFLSPDAVFEEGQAIRGGIPVCWPWFNKHPTDPSKPAHGIARNRFWEVESIEQTDAGTEFRFHLESDEDTLKLWPHPFELRLHVIVGAQLTVTLETTNTAESDITLGQALHTYFAVGEVEQIKVRGLDDTSFSDYVGERTKRQQSGEVDFHMEVNRIYYSTGTMMLDDYSLNRTIVVEKSGSGTSVVWNPWIEHSKKMGDLPDEGYHDFVCLETANAEDDVRGVGAGQTNTLMTRLSVKALEG